MTTALAPKSATGSSQLQCFQLTYQTLEGYANLLGRKIENHVTLADYHLHSCMYSTSSKQFIGRFCDSMRCSLVESLQTGAVMCPIQESVFFHCSQVEPSLILIIELSATYLSGNVEKCVSLGWCILPVFDRHGNQLSGGGFKASIAGGVARGDSVRLALYEGSPRMLLSIANPIAESKVLVPIPGCILTCSLRPHPTLAKASHLIPPKVVISYDDIIPGLIPTNVPEAFPKLMRTSFCHLEKVSLLLLPSVDDFEDHLLTTLSDDLTCEGSGVDGNSPITIEERRLKVVLYNGWTLVGSSVIGYLDKVSPSSGKTAGSFRGSMYGLRSNLILKGSLEITELIPHPLMEVVFLLEYVVGWSRDAMLKITPDTPSRRASANINANKPSSMHSTTLTLGWAVWQPFDPNQSIEEEQQPTDVSLELKSGPGFKPTIIPNSAHNACYQNNLTDAGKIAFKSIPTRASSRMDGSQYFASSVNIQLEDVSVRKTPVRNALSTGKDVPDSGDIAAVREPRTETSAVSSTPLRKKGTVSMKLAGAIDEVREYSEPLAPAVEVKSGGEPKTIESAPPQGSFQPLSRSTLAYFHASGLKEFTDIKGNPLPLTAMPTEPLASVPTDALQSGPYRIGIQLLGFIMSNEGLPSSPKHLNFNFHLYNYRPPTLHCSLHSPPATTSKNSPAKLHTLPHLIRPVRDSESGDDKKTTAVHCFSVSHQALPTKVDRYDFIDHLQCKHLIVDVFDGDSLIFLGSVNVPLKGLLCPPESASYFQLNLCCPILLSSSTMDPSLSPPSSSITTSASAPSTYRGVATGQLCLRLACLPPDKAETVSLERTGLPVLELSHPLPTTNSIARKLYSSPTSWSSESESREDRKTRERKLARMQKIRNSKNKKTTKDMISGQVHHQPPALVEEHHNIIDIQREELQREKIASVLQDFLTSHYIIRPRMGATVYFEYPFTNSHTHPLNVTVSWKDPDLKLVTKRQECQYLRNHFSITTTQDDNLITEGPEGGQYGFFIHPGETVQLPFKYQSFSAPLAAKLNEEKKTIKVYLQASHHDLLALLKLQVEPQRQKVDRVFHFYHPERTFIKKHFTFNLNDIITLSSNTPATMDLFACCSDPNAVSEIKASADDSSHTVYLKAPVNVSPTSHSLYIMLYNGKHLISPFEVWLVVLHPVCRVDHSVVIGQSSDIRLMLRGDHINRRVACYSFSAPVMKVVTPSMFLLNTQSLTEACLSIKSLRPGAMSVLVTAVDSDSYQIVKAWMVCGNPQEPTVTKAFQITLPIGGKKPITKAITFTNPYPKRRTFLLSTDKASIVKFVSTNITLEPQETSVLSLQFTPSSNPLTADVLVFINDEADQTEECFRVKTIYSQS